MKNETIIYFAYGANLNLDDMKVRCPGCTPLARARLLDHRLVFRGVADIEFRAFETVQGALYHITPAHLAALDRFEGYPRLYIRKTIHVITEDDRKVQAVVYQMTDRNQYARPSQGYLNSILTGCQQWQLPQEYIQYIINRAKKPDFGER